MKYLYKNIEYIIKNKIKINFKSKIKQIYLISFLGYQYNNLNYIKQIFYKIYGIGFNFIKILFCLFGINYNYFYTNKIDLSFLYKSQIFLKDFLINYELQKFINLNIKIKKKLHLYIGYRHQLFLPIRGQRSKTNAKNQKKKRK